MGPDDLHLPDGPLDSRWTRGSPPGATEYRKGRHRAPTRAIWTERSTAGRVREVVVQRCAARLRSLVSILARADRDHRGTDLADHPARWSGVRLVAGWHSAGCSRGIASRQAARSGDPLP